MEPKKGKDGPPTPTADLPSRAWGWGVPSLKDLEALTELVPVPLRVNSADPLLVLLLQEETPTTKAWAARCLGSSQAATAPPAQGRRLHPSYLPEMHLPGTGSLLCWAARLNIAGHLLTIISRRRFISNSWGTVFPLKPGCLS